MHRFRSPQGRTPLTLFLALSLACNLAWGVVGGAGVDANRADSPWAGVGAVIVGQGHFSGALVGRQWVLTAAHVVSGRPVEDIAFQLNLAATPGPPIPARAVHVHPRFTGARAGRDGFWHNDLALVELAEPAPGEVPVYPLHQDLRLHRAMVTFVGYGAAGDGLSGASLPGNRHVKRLGHNRIDRFIAGDDRRPEVMLFDFDGPDFASNAFKPDETPHASLGAALEATFAGGDSGAPMFVFGRGRWHIAGVAAFVAGSAEPRGRYGSVGGGILIPAHLSWIRGILAGTPTPP